MSHDECQCRRCGSSMTWEVCVHCVDGFTGHDCGEDCCSCANPEDNVTCDICEGVGGFGICLSSPEWCQSNPRPGFEAAERSTPEWFCWHGIVAPTACAKCAEEPCE